MQGSPQQQWQPTFGQGSYQGRGGTSSLGIPYAYGQLPVNVNPNDPKSQHPIPGSYVRHPFNPKTQSFVPGSGMPPMQQMGPSFGGGGPSPPGAGGVPPMQPPPLAYGNYQQPMVQTPYGSPGGGYNMVRQGSNTSLLPYHHPPMPQQPILQQPMPQQPMPQQPMSQQPMAHGGPLGGPHGAQPPPVVPQHLPQNPSPHIPNKPVSQGPPGQTFSHLPNYGNPATLPQKPT